MTPETNTGEVSQPSVQATTARPTSILVVGILGILAGGLGTLAAGFNTFGILIVGSYGGGSVELAYQALGFVLSVANVTGSITILSGRRWGRTLLFLVCGLSLIHGGVFNGILSGQTIGWAIWAAILISVLRSERARAFFASRSRLAQTD